MNRWQLRHAARIIHGGGIVAYPTEAVYGLGCDPLNGAAVMRLLQLKRRSWIKGVILVAAELGQLQRYIDLQTLDAERRQAVLASWPGPVTWLLPARANTPRWLTGRHDTLAVRLSAHPGVAALCQAAGTALVSTSANLSGKPPARSALDVRRVFDACIDYLLPGALGGRDRPTEIRDARSARIVRAG